MEEFDGLPVDSIQSMVKRFDADGNNQVDFSEFIEFYAFIKAKYVSHNFNKYSPRAEPGFFVCVCVGGGGFSGELAICALLGGLGASVVRKCS